MRTDAFGTDNASTEPSTIPQNTQAPTTGQPAPQPTPAPTTGDAAITTPPAPTTNEPAPSTATEPAKGKGSGKKSTTSGNTPNTPHMPAVGVVTKGNPTGDPSLNDDGTPRIAATSDGEPRPNDNTSEKLSALLSTAAELGAAEGRGGNSLGELGIMVANAAREGTISASSKSEDVANIWRFFSTKRQEARGDFSGMKEKSFEQQVSKLRAFAKAGNPEFKMDGNKVLARARGLINDNLGKGKLAGNTYNLLVSLAREISARGLKDKNAKGLTNPEILAFFSKPEPEPMEADEREADKIRIVKATILNILSGSTEYGPRESKELRTVYELLNTREATVKAEIESRVAEERKAQGLPPVAQTTPPAATTTAPASNTPPTSPPAAQVNNAA